MRRPGAGCLEVCGARGRTVAVSDAGPSVEWSSPPNSHTQHELRTAMDQNPRYLRDSNAVPAMRWIIGDIRRKGLSTQPEGGMVGCSAPTAAEADVRLPTG